MNRAIDSRSRPLLAGRDLLRAADRAAAVRGQRSAGLGALPHRAQAGAAAGDPRRRSPRRLPAIVLKLLAKVAEERYQSARGPRATTSSAASTQWRETGQHRAVRARRSATSSDRFLIPQKLYGRDAELRRAARGVRARRRHRQARAGAGLRLLGHRQVVAGARAAPADRRASAASSSPGKFDQYQRDIPYSTLVQAFRELVLEILAESDEPIGAWRERLQAALGATGQLIVELIPAAGAGASARSRRCRSCRPARRRTGSAWCLRAVRRRVRDRRSTRWRCSSMICSGPTRPAWSCSPTGHAARHARTCCSSAPTATTRSAHRTR